jgi:hypothetical protein
LKNPRKEKRKKKFHQPTNRIRIRCIGDHTLAAERKKDFPRNGQPFDNRGFGVEKQKRKKKSEL